MPEESRRKLTRLDPRLPLVIDTRELGRRPGSMRTLSRSVPAPADLGVDVLGVAEGSQLDLDLRLESVMEGVLVLDRDERIALANDAFAKMVGKDPDAIRGDYPCRDVAIRGAGVMSNRYPSPRTVCTCAAAAPSLPLRRRRCASSARPSTVPGAGHAPEMSAARVRIVPGVSVRFNSRC